jgi:membrane protein implicated in regulation of membrane protease activity
MIITVPQTIALIGVVFFASVVILTWTAYAVLRRRKGRAFLVIDRYAELQSKSAIPPLPMPLPSELLKKSPEFLAAEKRAKSIEKMAWSVGLGGEVIAGTVMLFAISLYSFTVYLAFFFLLIAFPIVGLAIYVEAFLILTKAMKEEQKKQQEQQKLDGV